VLTSYGKKLEGRLGVISSFGLRQSGSWRIDRNDPLRIRRFSATADDWALWFDAHGHIGDLDSDKCRRAQLLVPVEERAHRCRSGGLSRPHPGLPSLIKNPAPVHPARLWEFFARVFHR
jgi:hypothetical protein